MADDDYDYDEQPTDEPSPRDLRVQLKAAKAEAKDARELRTENDKLRQELVIRDAGITLNDRQRAALAATHDTAWTPEAIRKSAEELGFVQPVEAPPVVDDPSLSQIEKIAAASAGTDAPPASRDEQIDANLANAKTEAEFLEIYRASGRALAK